MPFCFSSSVNTFERGIKSLFKAYTLDLVDRYTTSHKATNPQKAKKMRNNLMAFSIFLTSAEPLLDAVRASLEAREGLWFICLLVASGGVAIGCVLEIPETWDDLKEWRKLRKESAEPPGWRVPMAAIGLLLVILGVIGEGVFEALVSMNETALRAHDEQALAATIKDAGTAKDSAELAKKAADRANDSSAAAVGAATKSLTLAQNATKEADSFERDIVSSKRLAADAESHLADALQRAAQAESESAKAQLELAKLTAPMQSVPVINGIATPDPTKGLRLRILLHSDIRIKLPTLSKGKAVSWTLFIVQDEVGNRQFSTIPHDVMFGNFLSHLPHSFCTMELVSDEYGTTDLTFGAANCPSNATDPTIPIKK